MPEKAISSPATAIARANRYPGMAEVGAGSGERAKPTIALRHIDSGADCATMWRMKKSMGVRLSDEARRLLKLLAQKLGQSQAGIIELAIRRLAEAEGIKTK